jgi:uncharacterized protein
MKNKRRILVLWSLVAAVIIFFVLLSATSGLIQKWLWMSQLQYQDIFWKILSIRWSLSGLAFMCVSFYIWINLRFVTKGASNLSEVHEVHNAGDSGPYFAVDTRVAPILSGVSSLFIACLLALIFAVVFYPQWDTYLRFHWGGLVGRSDPIYGLDIGFYLFRLPFYELIQNAVTGLTFVTFMIIGVAYMYLGVLQVNSLHYSQPDRKIIRHLSILFLLFICAWGWGYYLDRYELLYSTRGVVYGVGYTAHNITRVCLWIMFFSSIVLVILIAVNFFIYRFKVLLAGVGSYFILYFVLISVLPGLVQKFKVQPSELELETPYLKHNIDFTRTAFQLDGIEEKKYPGLSDLTLEDINTNPETIANIRIWDWRPILQTYRQTQEIRLYYEFYNVDVDRYRLKDGYHQVMLSARELAPELPAKARTWVNQRLQFTHGYGLVMNFVSKKAEGGLPQYIIENIPPMSESDLTVEQPDIYYGESMPGYRIVTTEIKEFDYPKGNENVYTQYQGKGGIPLDSFWKRVLFAWTQSDINILLTSYLGPNTRIQFWRRVQERIATIAPFLELDSDPYLVLSEGKLYWIQDAYTVSDSFPYSEPYQRSFSEFNYIRNSVKVIVDAYDGSVLFYIMDSEDPVLRVYRNAFPSDFKDLGEMPEDLKKHLRYPEDLFKIQGDIYRTYHMTDPQVFYNQEDLWTIPKEKYAGTAISLEPYYILMRLPGTSELQYLLMTPFTPQGKDNMVAWMAAKCDFPQYGKLIVYQLPKERLTFGPIQIEAMIDQNPLISGQLSLWDQKGSRVIRGNLVIIPINNSFLYVEPVYLIAEGTNMPQLKRIIVISGDRVEMDSTLDGALKAVFGASSPKPEVISAPVKTDELIRARTELDKAQKAIEQGQWGNFGKAMEELKRILTSQ